MKTKLLLPFFTLCCTLLVATIARSAVLYNHNFNNRNLSAPNSINSNMTVAWSSIGDDIYWFDGAGNPAAALYAHNHVYVITITMKERYQAELTSITFSRLSGDNANFQIQVEGVNYGSSITSNSSSTAITRTKTVSNLRNTIRIRIAVSNGTTVNNFSAIDNLTINGNITGYDPATEAQPDENGILYVDGNISKPGDGSSWEKALKRFYYATRAAALKPAIGQVWVAGGTYETEEANTALALTNGVAYYGGFEGYESDVRERNISTGNTILKGLGGNVLSASGVGASTRLDGFMVTEGTGLAVGGARHGGGLYLANSSPVITNCVFTNNHTTPSASDGKGGAIYLLNSSPLILQCIFAANSAKGTSSGLGGAIYLDNSSPTIRNTTFSANEVGGSSGAGNGGALYAAGSSAPIVENSIIWNNIDPASPGGVSSVNGPGTPNVSYSLIQGGFPGGTNILDTDPQFTNAAGMDFVQRKGSPVTDAGNPDTDLSDFPKSTADIPIPLNVNRRLTSRGIDLGPYEVTPSAIWYVNAASSSPAPAGDSWPNAFTTLNIALQVASEGDQIWVARGEYDEGTISMIHGVKFYGSFQGNETSLDQRPLPIAHNNPATATILSNTTIINDGNGLTHDDVLDGFTLSGAFSDDGGGMRNISVSPTITNCAFIGNSASDGGGIYNDNSSPLITNTVFAGNSAMFGSGGAIANRYGSNTILINCLLANNSADESAGAIYNDDASITLINCTVSGNEQIYPGAINGWGGSVTVRNSIIYGNDGGITNQEASISVSYSLAEGIAASDADHNLDGNTNPQFTSENDWTLLPCSPAINRGTNETLPDIPASTTDLANNPRIFNIQTDMGAYELQAIPGPGTLPASGESATLPVYAGATPITADCKTFGLIEPTGTPGTLGSVTVKAFLAAGNTVAEGTKVFVKRHYDITPSGTDGPAKVTLYFSKQDFDAYNQAYGNANDASLPANLKVVQYHGTSPYGFPGTYSGPTQVITNITVTESADQTMYLVSFQVTGFSGFFVTGQPESALPVTLVSFQAKKRENQAYLQWQTNSEINSRLFEIERSRNGKEWHYLGEVNAQGDEHTRTEYSYTDALPMAGTNMYRLKMIDRAADGEEGSFAYSRISAVEFAAEAAALYPNPAVNASTVHVRGVAVGEIVKASIVDLTGRNPGGPLLQNGSIDVSGLKTGTYTVEIVRTDGEKVHFRLAVIK
ncbi:T9SS type A sorting domain-containing protein [Dyadobacter sp. CY261]|uniref:choice-of-anchor Q domain-containing protein n=1 Tax=Dyadobacter sp. CY261 TaxID=2907203 RepID=UPI001F3358E6|nr:choice-of-anchor Q domain-containing protein [Dyadobacter sp. CY261]MCF0074716.1 T9SS type A sorting domain-containing protein [Dyadobacter sp. CY261]